MNMALLQFKQTPQKIKNFFNRLLNKVKSSDLPTGMSDFHKWSDSIIETYELKTLADVDSIKFVLSTAILHFDPTCAAKSKEEMANRVKKAAANQVASAVFQDIKVKQQAAQQVAVQAQAVATAPAESVNVRQSV